MPSTSEYREAMQHAGRCFKDPDLRACSPVKANGLPRATSGNFAVVFNLRSHAKSWAVRCFHKHVPDINRRYHAISEHLEAHRSQVPSLVEFRYVPEGVLVNDNWYPIVVMDWVNGIPLDDAVSRWIDQPDQLERLGDRWIQLDRELLRAGIAHGDLQHGNVLVADGKLQLVDYDGMYVPALRGERAGDQGHPNYQPPWRTDRHFSEELDRFSILVIYTALRALRNDPSLWSRYAMPDDALLFRKSDFAVPKQSALINQLLRSDDHVLKGLVEEIRIGIERPTAARPLGEVLSSLQPAPAQDAPRTRSWKERLFGRGIHKSVNERSWWDPGRPPTSSTSATQKPGANSAVPPFRSSSTPAVHPQNPMSNPARSGGEWWRSQPSQSFDPVGSPQPPFGARKVTGDTPGLVKVPATGPNPLPPQPSSGPVRSSQDARNTHNRPLGRNPPSIAATRTFVASRNRDKFHLPTCEYGSQIPPDSAVWFTTADEAQRPGYKACRVCRPRQSAVPSSAGAAGRIAPTPPRPAQPAQHQQKASVGNEVEVQFGDGRIERFLLVPEGQRRPSSDDVSIASPFGQAVLGARVGQSVRYAVGGEAVSCTILRIS